MALGRCKEKQEEEEVGKYFKKKNDDLSATFFHLFFKKKILFFDSGWKDQMANVVRTMKILVHALSKNWLLPSFTR